MYPSIVSNNTAYKPWMFDLVKHRLGERNQQINIQGLNQPKYVCKIFDMTYNFLTNTPFKHSIGIQTTLFDGETKIPASVKITHPTETIKYEQNKYLDLKQFILQLDHKTNNIHILILKSEPLENISFVHDNNNKNINFNINKNKEIKDIIEKHLLLKPFTTNAKSVDLFFPYPIFKKPTYSLINKDNEEKQMYIPGDNNTKPRKRQKLDVNSLQVQNISASNQLFEVILKHPLYFDSALNLRKSQNVQQYVLSTFNKSYDKTKNAFAD